MLDFSFQKVFRVQIPIKTHPLTGTSGPAVSNVTCKDKLIVSIKLRQRDKLSKAALLDSSASRFVVERSSNDKASDIPGYLATTSPRPHNHGLKRNVKELEDGFSGGVEEEELDGLLMGSEYDISCAQPKHKPFLDERLWEVKQKRIASPDKFQTNRVLEFGAVQTEYEMEDRIFTSEFDKSGSGIVDIMEKESPWKLFTENLSPQIQLSQRSSPESGSCVLTERTRRDLVNLLMCDESGEGEVGGCSDCESLELEEEAIWGDGVQVVEGKVKKASGEERIPQLDGTTSPSVDVASISSTQTRSKTFRMRKKHSWSSKKSSSPQDSKELLTDASVEVIGPVPMGETFVPQGGTARTDLTVDHEDTHSSEEVLHSSCSLRVQQQLSLKTRDKSRRRTVRIESAKPKAQGILKERALACKFVLKLEQIHPSTLSLFCGGGIVVVQPKEEPQKVHSSVGGKRRRRRRRKMVDSLGKITREVVKESSNGMEVPTEVHMRPIPSSSTSECPLESANGFSQHFIASPVTSAVPTPLVISPLWSGGNGNLAVTDSTNASGIRVDPCLSPDGPTTPPLLHPCLSPDGPTTPPLLHPCLSPDGPTTPPLLQSGGTISGKKDSDISPRHGGSEINTAAFSPTLPSWDMVSPYDSQVDSDFHLCVSSESEVDVDSVEVEGVADLGVSCDSIDLYKTKHERTLITSPVIPEEEIASAPPLTMLTTIASAPPPTVQTTIASAQPPTMPKDFESAPPPGRQKAFESAPSPEIMEGFALATSPTMQKAFAPVPPLGMQENFLGGVSSVQGLVWQPLIPPLSPIDLSDSAHLYHIPSVVHTKPLCSKHGDVQPAK